MGCLRGEMGDVDGALRLVDLARTKYVDVSPFPLAWMDAQEATLLEKHGRRADAKAHYARALSLLPLYATAASGTLAPGLSRPAEAVALLEPVAASSDDPEVLAQLSDALRRSGRADDAEKQRTASIARYEELLARHPAAFADHAASMWLGIGRDPARAVPLARANLAVRRTSDAYELFHHGGARVEKQERRTLRCGARGDGGAEVRDRRPPRARRAHRETVPVTRAFAALFAFVVAIAISSSWRATPTRTKRASRKVVYDPRRRESRRHDWRSSRTPSSPLPSPRSTPMATWYARPRARSRVDAPSSHAVDRREAHHHRRRGALPRRARSRRRSPSKTASTSRSPRRAHLARTELVVHCGFPRRSPCRSPTHRRRRGPEAARRAKALVVAGSMDVEVAKVGAAGSSSFRALLLLGVEHILTGYDHLVFLFGLIVMGGRTRSLVMALTAFTVAHSISPRAGGPRSVGAEPVDRGARDRTLDRIRRYRESSPRTTQRARRESGWTRPTRRRVTTRAVDGASRFRSASSTGSDSAGALADIGLPRAAVPGALFAFNLGVELGQLGVLAILLPLLTWARRSARRPRHAGTTAANIAVVAAGLAVVRASRRDVTWSLPTPDQSPRRRGADRSSCRR